MQKQIIEKEKDQMNRWQKYSTVKSRKVKKNYIILHQDCNFLNFL